jgi:hypothetical protein
MADSKRKFVSLSKGRTPLGLPDDLPLGAHPMDWFLCALRAALGHDKAAAFIGVQPEPVGESAP